MKKVKLFAVIIVVLVAVLVGFFYFWTYLGSDFFKKDLKDVSGKKLSGKRILLSEGKTYVETAGPESGHPVVFIHGASIPHVTWNRNFYVLAEAGFFCVRYDAYGRGYSDRPDGDYGMSRYTGQLKDLIDALGIKKKFSIVSLSFGGPVTAAFVSENFRKIHKVVFIAPAVYSIGDMDAFKFFGHVKKLFIRMTHKDEHRYYYRQLEHVREKMAFQFKYKGTVRAGVSMMKNIDRKSIKSDFEKIGTLDIPVLAVWGTDDPIIDYNLSRPFLEIIPQAKLVSISNGGHIPHYVYPGIVNKEIYDFLRE